MKRFPLFSLVGLVLSGLIFLPPAFSQTTNETFTISTYYPSPYGVYKELRLYPNTSPTTCDSLTEGNMYYNSATDEVMVCKGIGGSYNWQSMSGLWTLNGTSLYPNNTAWNVGIGTTNPQRSLHVVATGTVVPPLAPRHRVVIQDNGAPLNAVSLVLLGGNAGGSGVDFGDTDAIAAGRILYRHDTDSMQFFTNAAERLRIDNAGNVGIGRIPGTIPSSNCPGGSCPVRLDIAGNILRIQGNSPGGALPTGISIDEDSPAGAGIPAQAGYSLSRLGVQQWGVVMDSDNSFIIWNPFGAGIHISPPGTGGNVGIRNGNPNPLAPNGAPGNLDVNDIYLRSTGRWASRSPFLQSANGSYTLYMQDDGNLVIYGPGGLYLIQVPGGGQYGPNHLRSGSGQYYLAMQGDNNLVVYDLWSGWSPKWWSQNTLSCANSCWSDVSLKENIDTLDGALAKIQQLRGVSFRWKDKQRGEGPQIGLIAQEVEKVFPEVVGSMSGLKSVEYGRLVAPLIEAIKEQQEQFEEQRQLIQRLQLEVNTLKKIIRKGDDHA